MAVLPANHECLKSKVDLVLSNESSQEEPDMAATKYPTAPEWVSPGEAEVTECMLNVLLPNRASVIVAPQPANNIETRQKKSSIGAKICNRLPPLIIEPRPNINPIAARKTIWIIHPDHPDQVAAAGKSGVSWRCKSSKQGPLCKEGMQWLFVHRVFVEGLTVMYPDPDVSSAALTDSLPSWIGRQKPIKWDSKYLVQYDSRLFGLPEVILEEAPRQVQQKPNKNHQAFCELCDHEKLPASTLNRVLRGHILIT